MRNQMTCHGATLNPADSDANGLADCQPEPSFLTASDRGGGGRARARSTLHLMGIPISNFGSKCQRPAQQPEPEIDDSEVSSDPSSNGEANIIVLPNDDEEPETDE